VNVRNAERRATAPEVHAYSYTLSRRGQWHAVVRANDQETDSRPLPSRREGMRVVPLVNALNAAGSTFHWDRANGVVTITESKP
jgi:hypothetical protein